MPRHSMAKQCMNSQGTGTATHSMVKHAMVKLSFAFMLVTAARSFDVIAPPEARAKTREAFSDVLCNGTYAASAFSRLSRPLRLARLCPSELPQLCSHNLLLRLVRVSPELLDRLKGWLSVLTHDSIQLRSHARTHARTRTHALTHARTHTHTHARARTHARTHAPTHERTHARTHALTHAHTHVHTHERTPARAPRTRVRSC